MRKSTRLKKGETAAAGFASLLNFCKRDVRLGFFGPPLPPLTTTTKTRSAMGPTPAIDVVARLYELFQARPASNEDQLPALQLLPPQSVVDKLSTLGFPFGVVPRTLHHALMWEAGHATTADGEVVAFRTHCGVSTADALSQSTAALPTCALHSSTYSRGGIAWLAFSNTSPLPTLLYSLPTRSSSSQLVALFPCRTTKDDEADNASFCPPPPSPALRLWISEYATVTVRTDAAYQQANTTTTRAVSSGRSLSSAVTASNLSFANQPALDLSADFTSALYAFRAAGASLPHIKISTGVPLDVKSRLDASHQSFDTLSGLLQRAVLWDTGYAIVRRYETSTTVDVVPVHVKCGLRMANIAPDRTYFESTGCAVQDCSLNNTSTGDTSYSWRAHDCPLSADNAGMSAIGSNLLAVTRCAIPASSTDSLDIPRADTATVWAVGTLTPSEQVVAPRLRLQQHPSSTTANKWYAIYFAASEVAVGTCPSMPSFIIPCVTVDQPSLQQEWCRPVQSELIATWLRQEQHQEMALITLILMAGAILLALALDLFVDRKPRMLVNGQVGVSMPSLTSTVFEGREDDVQEPENNSVRSAESVRSAR